MMNKSLIGFCSFFLLTLVLMGFVSSWLLGLLRLAVAIVAIILLLRLFRKDLDWQTNLLSALGITFMTSIILIGADFILPRH